MREFKVRAVDLNRAGADITYVNHDRDLDQSRRDSFLIAASDDMLKALLLAESLLWDFSDCDVALKVREAIQKARGLHHEC